MSATLFDDAAPLAGGAGVNGRNGSPDPSAVRLTPPAHHNAPTGTSAVAAQRIAGHAGRLRDRVRDYIASRGAVGATDDEGEAAMSIRPQSYTPRRGELVALGIVRDSGRRRATASGRPAAVWVTADHAPRTEGGAE